MELSNTGNTVAKPSVFVTAPSWCLVLEVSPLGVPSKGFSYFFMDKKVKEKMSFALLHQTLKRGLARASLRMKLMPAAHSPCLVRLSASLVAGPKEVWSIKVRSPFGSPFEVKVKRTCSGRNLWLQVVLATEKLAGRGTVDIDSLYDGNRCDCPLPLCCLGLSNGCTVDAIDKKDQEWVIFIKCPDGSVIATPASKEESCIDLHRRVAAMLATQLPVSPSDVYTTFGSKLLEHTKAKLWETGMHNGSTVMANIRLRGGVCVPHTGNLKRRQNQVNTNHPIHGLVPKEYPLVFKKNLH